MTTYSTARYFLEGLNEVGIDYIFCNFGTDHAPIIEEMACCEAENRRYPKPISCPHENVAIHMANGYALATGRGQAVMVHVDVGTANTVAGVHNLFRSRTPVMLLAGKAPYTVHGELPGSRNHYIHFIQEPYDMGSIVRQYVKWEYNLPSGVVVKEALRRAHSIMQSDPHGPVYITLQREALMQEFAPEAVHSFSAEDFGATLAGGADEQTICMLADRLLSARNPVLITAYSGRNSNCPAVIKELSELVGIKVFEYFPVHLNIDRTSTTFLGFLPDKALETADLALLVDVDVPFIPVDVTLNPKIQCIHIDIDTVKKDIPVWGFTTHIRVQADSYKVLSRLLEVIRMRVTPQRQAQVQQRMKEIAAERQVLNARIRSLAADHGTPGRINPAYLCAEISKVMGPDDIVVNEAVGQAPPVLMQIPRCRPGTYFCSSGGGLGMGGGTALGLKLAKPERNVFHLTGDGSFYFSTPSAVYAVSKKEKLPIFTVIFDNSGWQAVKDVIMKVYPNGKAKEMNQLYTLAANADLHKIGEAFGAYGEAVSDSEEVPAALERCLKAVNHGRSAVLVARVPKIC